MLDKSHVREKVEGMSNMSTIPDIVTKLRRMMASPTVSAAMVGDEISKDQVLAAKVLRLVNSGFYGFRTPITTITQAMVLLGFDVVKTLVLSASVLDILELMNRYLSGLWEHSLATARVANALAERLCIPNPEEIAVSGLLHDLGKVVIAQRFPAEHQEIRVLVRARGCLQIEAEREVLGSTHPEIGMWLLKKWGLPAKLFYPIAYHTRFHRTRDFADRTAIIHLADVMCRARGYGSPGDNRVPAINRDAWALVRITMTDVEDVFIQLDSELSDMLAV
ncbi:MAG TPA: HDOD domain-containing protein [Vicinamibacterales bacterium]|jgi:putative nucleotidyltransferase with HDIG domain